MMGRNHPPLKLHSGHLSASVDTCGQATGEPMRWYQRLLNMSPSERATPFDTFYGVPRNARSSHWRPHNMPGLLHKFLKPAGEQQPTILAPLTIKKMPARSPAKSTLRDSLRHKMRKAVPTDRVPCRCHRDGRRGIGLSVVERSV